MTFIVPTNAGDVHRLQQRERPSIHSTIGAPEDVLVKTEGRVHVKSRRCRPAHPRECDKPGAKCTTKQQIMIGHSTLVMGLIQIRKAVQIGGLHRVAREPGFPGHYSTNCGLDFSFAKAGHRPFVFTMLRASIDLDCTLRVSGDSHAD